MPLSSTYSILFMLTAQHEGPSATAQLFARQRHIVGASRNPLQHLIMAAIYVTWVHVTPKKEHVYFFCTFFCKIPLQNCTCIIIIYYNFILYIIIRLFEPFSQLKLLHSSGILKPNRKRHRQFRCFNPSLGGVFLSSR